jgi:hypothetical protein
LPHREVVLPISMTFFGIGNVDIHAGQARLASVEFNGFIIPSAMMRGVRNGDRSGQRCAETILVVEQ